MPRTGYSADISRSRVTATSAFLACGRAEYPAAAASVPAEAADRNRRRVTAATALLPGLLEVLEQVPAVLRGERVEQLLGHERRRQLAERLDPVAADPGPLPLRVHQGDARPVLLGEDAGLHHTF